MQDSDIKNLWEKNKTEIYIDPDKKAKSLQLLQRTANEKKLPEKNSRTQIIFRQISYMDKRFFTLHLTGNFLILLLLIRAEKTISNPENIYVISMILSILMGMFSMAAPAKMFSSKLTELSESCYFNVRQIFALDMVISGGLNLITFLIIIPFVSIKWQVSLLRFGMYLLVPYVFTQSCCLSLLLTETGRAKPVLILFAGAFLMVTALTAASIPGIYETWALHYWCYVFIAGIVILFLRIRNFFTAIEKGEILCTH